MPGSAESKANTLSAVLSLQPHGSYFIVEANRLGGLGDLFKCPNWVVVDLQSLDGIVYLNLPIPKCAWIVDRVYQKIKKVECETIIVRSYKLLQEIPTENPVKKICRMFSLRLHLFSSQKFKT